MIKLKKQISKNFSKAVKTYEKSALAQKESAQTLISLLPNKNYKSILDIGCGTGFLLTILKKMYPESSLTGLDISEGMVTHCQKKWPKASFICADAENFKTKKRYSLIATNFSIQWFKDIDSFIKNHLSFLAKDGILAIGLPLKGSLHELSEASKKANNKALTLLPFPQKKQIQSAIKKIPGALLLDSKTKKITTLYKNSVSAIKDFKKIGATYKNKEFYSVKQMRNLLSAYEKMFLTKDKQIPLTYKTGYFIITKK